MDIQAFGGRRFILTVMTGLGTFALQWSGKLSADGATFAAVMIGIVGAFIAGDVTEKKNIIQAGGKTDSTTGS